jgi:hypothetical protein
MWARSGLGDERTSSMAQIAVRTSILVVAVAVFGVNAGPALGAMISGTIGPPDCVADDCLGGNWTLEVTDVPLNPGYDVHVTLVAGIPSTGLVDDEGPISPTHIVNVDFALPGDITGNVATNVLAMSFLTSTGPLGAGGCGSVNSNFLCATGSAPIVPGSDLTWEWDVNVSDVGAIFDPANRDSFHLGARAWSADHPKGWLVSTNPIPEPSAALVFAVGFGVVATAARRRSA